MDILADGRVVKGPELSNTNSNLLQGEASYTRESE